MLRSLVASIKGDKVIWIVLFVLTLFSMLIVYSATGSLANRNLEGNTLFYLIRHLFMILLGYSVVVVIVNWIPLKYISIFSPLVLLIAIVLLVVAFILKEGDASGRTVSLGFISFQPTELAKIGLIMFISRILANYQDKEHPPSRNTFLIILGVSGLVCLLIALVDFSTSALLFAAIMTLMFVGRIPLKFLGATLLGGVLVMSVFYGIGKFTDSSNGRFDTIVGRIDRFVKGDPNSEKGLTTQADFAEMAIYNGGRTGKGPGGSEVRNYMAAAYNDFIFAILIEEYGWFSFIIVFAYIVFTARAAIIIRKSKRTYAAFMVAGLSALIVFQAMINMGVSVGLLPVTGQTLPWVSMGGTSTLFTAVSFGAILRASYQNKLEKVEKSPIEERLEEPLDDEDHSFAEVGAIH